MKVPFVDLKAQYQSIRSEILPQLEAVCENTSFVLGPFVKKFEEDFARFVGVKHALGVSNGTAADQLAIQALIRPGDEVITTPNTFFATTEAITAAGGKIVFADIEEDSYNIDPEKVAAAITPRTRMIVPIHLYGQPADMDPLLEIARQHRLYVVEDSAQAHGAQYKGRNAGSMGDAAAFSFYPGKNLGAYGEAGAVTTNSDEVAEFVNLYRDHGSRIKYEHEIEGHNMRMEGFQGAVLAVKLKHLPAWTAGRRRAAAVYNELLREVPGVITPAEMPYARHVYHLYVIRVKDREGLSAYLNEMGIGNGYHYKYPLHLQKAYAHMGFRPGDFPVTEQVMKEIISLPMFPELQDGQIEYVANAVKKFVSK